MPDEVASAAPPQIHVEPSVAPGFKRVFGRGYHSTVGLMTAVSSLATVLAFWAFSYSFWVLLESAAQAENWPRGDSFLLPLLDRFSRQSASQLIGGRGWPVDVSLIIAALAAWALLYLSFDGIGAYQNAAAQARLREKAERLLASLPETGFFVEVRRTTSGLPLPSDIGWLLFFPDRLEFIADERRAVIPRSRVLGNIKVLRSLGDLGSTWVRLELSPPYGDLRLLNRDGIICLSATIETAPDLAAALEAWLASPADLPI